MKVKDVGQKELMEFLEATKNGDLKKKKKRERCISDVDLGALGLSEEGKEILNYHFNLYSKNSTNYDCISNGIPMYDEDEVFAQRALLHVMLDESLNCIDVVLTSKDLDYKVVVLDHYKRLLADLSTDFIKDLGLSKPSEENMDAFFLRRCEKSIALMEFVDEIKMCNTFHRILEGGKFSDPLTKEELYIKKTLIPDELERCKVLYNTNQHLTSALEKESFPIQNIFRYIMR